MHLVLAKESLLKLGRVNKASVILKLKTACSVAVRRQGIVNVVASSVKGSTGESCINRLSGKSFATRCRQRIIRTAVDVRGRLERSSPTRSFKFWNRLSAVKFGLVSVIMNFQQVKRPS